MDSAIWTEKYRPKDFSEIKGQKEIVKRIKAFVELQNIPHLLFAGPAGVGKTTLALVVAKKIFKEQWHQNFLELNASLNKKKSSRFKIPSLLKSGQSVCANAILPP